jgi:uncharacterized membrane protein
MFKERNKQIVIMRFILLIPMLIYVVYSFSHDNINHIYKGLFDVLLVVIIFLSIIEERKKLKKKESNELKLLLLSAIIFFIIGILELFGI